MIVFQELIQNIFRKPLALLYKLRGDFGKFTDDR